MKIQFATYSSLLTLMMAMSTPLPAVTEDEDQGPTTTSPVATNQSQQEEWVQNLYERKYLFSEPTLKVKDLTVSVLTSTMGHKKDPNNPENNIKIARLQELMTQAIAQQSQDSDLQAFLFKVYSGKFSSDAPFVNSLHSTQVLNQAYDQGWAWAFWERAQLSKEHKAGKLSRDHYMAANRGHKEAVNHLKGRTGYSITMAQEFVKKFEDNKKNRGNRKIAKNSIDGFIRNWETTGYAQPLIDVWELAKDKKLIAQAKDLKDKPLEVAAELGNPQARNNLAMAYLKNAGQHYRNNKLKEAQELYEKAAELGNAEAMFNLGNMVREKNPERAIEYYKEAAKLGYVKAMVNLGSMIKSTHLEKAIEYYEEAANLRNPLAMFMLGDMVRENNLEKAQEWYEKAANLGHVGAIYNLGIILQEKNPEEAIMHFRKAAQLGDYQAIYNLGVMLQEKNPEEAKEFFEKAAESGNLDALVKLGLMVEDTNLKQAKELYQKAVRLKHAGAMFCLANLIQEENPEGAERLFREAAEKGCFQAMHNLAVMNIIEDPATAKRWLLKAAQKDFAPSMTALGYLFLNQGNLEDAIFWLEKAASLGNKLANTLLASAQKAADDKAKATEEDIANVAPSDANVRDELDDELDQIFEAIENPKPLESSSIAQDHLKLQTAEETNDNSSDDELEETTSSEGDDVNDQGDEIEEKDFNYQSYVAPKTINNPKTRREMARALGLKQNEIKAAEAQEDRKLQSNSQTLANAILNGDTDGIQKENLQALFSDPYFLGQVKVQTTKSGFTVLSHHRKKNLHLNTGTHKKHGQEKFTGHIHPNTLRDIKTILNNFDVTSK